jgi:iron complex outermembrane receptor protein
MTTKFVKGVMLATSALVAATATPALAQRANSNATLGEIVVTARRVEERLQDVPISISVYTPQELQNRNISNLADLALYTPSLAVNSRFGPERASFVIRAFNQDLNTNPSVGTYFADVIAPRLSSNITSGNGVGSGVLFDLQNIQVLKGPQGTLFGRNTTGGSILIVPQRPTKNFEGYVEGTVGNYDARRLQAVVNVPVNDQFRLRFGLDRYKRDGTLHNVSGIGPDDFNDVNYTSARISALWDVTPELENYTVWQYSYSKTHGTVGVIAMCNLSGAGTAADGATAAAPIRAFECAQLAQRNAQHLGYWDVQNQQPRPFEKLRQWQAINTTTWHANDTLTVKNIVSYARVRNSSVLNIEGDNTPLPFVQTFPGNTGPQGQQETFTEELQLQGRTSDDRLTWQGGAYAEISKPTGAQDQWTEIFSPLCNDLYNFVCPAGPFGTGGRISIARHKYWYYDYAFYAQATYKITEQLRFTAGFRYTWDKEKGTEDDVTVTSAINGIKTPSQINCTAGSTLAATDPARLALLTSGFCFREFQLKSHRPTWNLDLDYKPNEDTLLYVKWARGYRAGGINPSNSGAETWGPEKLDDYEIGTKLTWSGHDMRGVLDIDAFYNDFQNQQVSVFVPNCTIAIPGCTNPAPVGINGIFNVGKSVIKGVEVDAMVQLRERLRFELGYAFLKTEVKSFSVPFCEPTRFNCAAASGPTIGGELFFAPRNRITLTATYDVPVDENIGDIQVGATFTHTDHSFFSHADDHAYSIGIIPFNPSVIPSTDLLNLNLNWNNIARKPVDLSIFATNVTNRKYYVASTNALSSTGAEFLILGEPRVYGMRLKYRFGH